MPANIRTYAEESTPDTQGIDARTTAFMESLRARVASKDEKQRLEWEKATKAAARRKTRPVVEKAEPDDGGAEVDDDSEA